MRKIALAFCLALVAAGPVGAQQFTEQRNVVKHMVDAAMLQEHCPDWQVDTQALGLMMTFWGVNAADIERGGRYEAFATGHAAENMIAFRDLAPEHACMMAELLFGPKGGNVPNLMHRRD